MIGKLPNSPANPQSMDPSKKRSTDTIPIFLREYVSASLPYVGAEAVEVIRYAVATQA